MKLNHIFIIATLIYITLMYICYNDYDVISLINMLFITLIYIAFFIAVFIIDTDKEKQN